MKTMHSEIAFAVVPLPVMNPFEKMCSFFTVANAESGTKVSCGRVMDFCFYTRNWNTTPFAYVLNVVFGKKDGKCLCDQ